MDQSDTELIAAVLQGNTASFEPLVAKYSPRVFATARRYARRDSEVEDIAQEVWLKAFDKLKSFRGEAPFEHWLMRLTVRTCYDFLRRHQRNRESPFSDLTEPENDWLERFVAAPESVTDHADAAKLLVDRILDKGIVIDVWAKTPPFARETGLAIIGLVAWYQNTHKGA